MYMYNVCENYTYKVLMDRLACIDAHLDLPNDPALTRRKLHCDRLPSLPLAAC